MKVGDKYKLKASFTHCVVRHGVVYTITKFDKDGDPHLDNGAGPFFLRTFNEYFEPVEKEKPMFKVGDKVRCLASHYSNLTLNKIYEVVGDEVDRRFDLVNDKNTKEWFPNVFNFQLAGVRTTDEEIVKRFNELVKADKVQYHSNETNWTDFRRPEKSQYRLKPTKKEFGLNVLLNDGGRPYPITTGTSTILIGCHTFDSKELLKNLEHLFKNGVEQDNLIPVKDGIVCREELIPWAEAEKLLKALREYLK